MAKLDTLSGSLQACRLYLLSSVFPFAKLTII